MATEEGKLTVEDSMENAYQKYRQLKQEVEVWQKERGTYWKASLNLNEESPYLPIVDLPQDAIVELWQRLNISAKEEMPDSTLTEIWRQLKLGNGTISPELATRLQMAINGVAKLASQIANEKGVPEQKQNPRASENPVRSICICPVCGEATTLAVLTAPDGKRVLHCNTCSFEWPVQSTGCLFCGSEDDKKILYLDNETFPGIDMGVCQVCGQYLKEIDGRKLYAADYYWEDMRTLPLNYATERYIQEQLRKDNQIN